MPTRLGLEYDRTWRGKPPHMLQPDVPVWWRFLDKWSSLLDRLWYDCLLGGPEMSFAERQDPLKQMWVTNLSKRADAIAVVAKELWIIEVASDPGLRAIGQLQTYHTLWLRDPVITLPEVLVLVGERIDPDLLDACAMHGIRIFMV